LHADGLVEIVGAREVKAGLGAAQQALWAEQVGTREPDAKAGVCGLAWLGMGELANDCSEREIAIARDRREQ